MPQRPRLHVLLLTLALAVAADVTMAGDSAPGKLRAFIWAEYLSPRVLQNFEAKTAVQVEQVYFGSEEQREKRMFSGFMPDFDVVLVDDSLLQSYVAAGLVLDLSAFKLDAFKQIDPDFRSACGDHGLPYTWGTYGFAYRRSVVKQEMRSWRDLYHVPPSLDGLVVLPEDTEELIGGALQALGYRYDSEDAQELHEAYVLLSETARHVMHFGYSLNLLEQPALLDKVAAVGMYNSDFLYFQENAPQDDWEFVYPEDGVTIWVDCLTVSSGSKHVDTALQLLNFVSRPEQAAINVADSVIATTVTAALPMIDATLRTNAMLFPPPAVMQHAQWDRAIDNVSAVQLRNRIRYAVTLYRHED